MHPGQLRAWDSERRFVVVLSGTQSGKTAYGPWWLWREIRERGEGDYLAVTASYDLFKLKMLPALLDTFVHKLGIGTYRAADRVIELSNPRARIILRSAESAGGLESSTAKGAWFDEAGQDTVGIDVWEAILRRLSINQGRALITTTIYNMGWLKSALYDRWHSGDPDIDIVQFDSTDNPAFPADEFERARATLPLWKFNMFYRGQFERPAGLIYDCYRDEYAASGGHVVPAFAIPAEWPRYLGLDFGGVNTAGIFYAHEAASGRFYAYREYLEGGRTAQGHATALLAGEPMVPFCVGGSKSEGQWRREFKAAGLPVAPPYITEVEVGINRVYGAHKQDSILVFDTLARYRQQKLAYSRKLDAAGEPTEEIADKATYHLMDAERYIVGRMIGGGSRYA
jgi:hypothetical protein